MTDEPRPAPVEEVHELMWWSPMQQHTKLEPPCIGAVALVVRGDVEGDHWKAYIGVGWGRDTQEDMWDIVRRGASMAEWEGRMYAMGRFTDIPYRA